MDVFTPTFAVIVPSTPFTSVSLFGSFFICVTIYKSQSTKVNKTKSDKKVTKN